MREIGTDLLMLGQLTRIANGIATLVTMQTVPFEDKEPLRAAFFKATRKLEKTDKNVLEVLKVKKQK